MNDEVGSTWSGFFSESTNKMSNTVESHQRRSLECRLSCDAVDVLMLSDVGFDGDAAAETVRNTLNFREGLCFEGLSKLVKTNTNIKAKKDVKYLDMESRAQRYLALIPNKLPCMSEEAKIENLSLARSVPVDVDDDTYCLSDDPEQRRSQLRVLQEVLRRRLEVNFVFYLKIIPTSFPNIEILTLNDDHHAILFQ